MITARWEDRINPSGHDDVLAARDAALAEQRAAIAALRDGSADEPPPIRRQRQVSDVPASEWTPERIKAIRVALNLSQDRMAKEVGVAQKTLSEWETGKYRPRLVQHRNRLAELEQIAKERVAG
jgi:DNA-binding XRE family transcriptional regulator